MRDKLFLDTNVLVYLYDSDAPEKQERARAILERDGTTAEITISTQVLQEFYVTVARKFAKRLSEEETLLATRSLCQLSLIQVDVAMIFDAISLARRHQFALWDSLIIQAALQTGCNKLMTEDLQDGQRIGNLRIENPFKP